MIGIEGFPKIRVELVLSCVCLFNSFLQHLVAKCKSSDPTALAMEGGGTSGQMAKRWCHMWLTAKEGLPKSLKICTYHRAGQTRTSQIFTQVGEHSCRHGRWVTSSRPIFLGSLCMLSVMGWKLCRVPFSSLLAFRLPINIMETLFAPYTVGTFRLCRRERWLSGVTFS